jgi:hypothetical protein
MLIEKDNNSKAIIPYHSRDVKESNQKKEKILWECLDRHIKKVFTE